MKTLWSERLGSLIEIEFYWLSSVCNGRSNVIAEFICFTYRGKKNIPPTIFYLPRLSNRDLSRFILIRNFHAKWKFSDFSVSI